MPEHIYLTKDSNALVSFCKCKDALVTFPPQQDCPWCGCGWLFTCIVCRKAFTFARGVMLHEAWDATARRDLVNATGQEPRANEVAEWVAGMQELLADVQIGHQYVCLDGTIIPADAARVEFDGWHSRHRLEFLPHVAALSDDSVERDILANMDYWESNRLQRK